MRLSEIKPYKKNAKKHDETQIKNVMQSIKEFGVVQPIVVDRNNTIIIGHCRYEAMKRLGYDELQEDWVKVVDLPEEEAEKLRLLDNKLNESDWDKNLLEEFVPNLDFSEYDLDWGFNLEMGTDITEDEPPQVDEEHEPILKIGDIYQLGEHRLMCGDSTDKATVELLMDGKKADMVFTDPPYGMNLDTDYSGMKNNLDFAKSKNFTGGKKYEQGKVDDFNPQMIDAVLSIDAKEMFLWGADYFAEFLPCKNDGSWIVWDKRANGNDDIEEDYSSDKMYGSCFELCWSKNRHKRDIARVKWAGVFGTEQEFDHKRYHPTQKPIKLVEWFLKRYSKDGHIVIDLFGGSGSTLIACEQLNRTCYMMELDPKYCDVILKRYINLKGSSEDVYRLNADGTKTKYSELN